METLEEQPTRRSTRSALAEIPTHLSMFSIVDPDGTSKFMKLSNYFIIFNTFF